jgi:hypothetical protein
MRKTATLAAMGAATVVTAMLASTPSTSQPFVMPPTTFSDAAAMMQQTAVVAGLLCVWLIGSIVLTLVSGKEIRYSANEVRIAPLHCLIVGLLALTSFVLTGVAFNYLTPYIIGTPLLIALGVFAILTKIYGMVAVFHAVGSKLFGPRKREDLLQRRWLRGDMAMVLAGLLVLGAIRLIPVVGAIVWGTASVFGVGVALATKFGKREPWFLAWRAIET